MYIHNDYALFIVYTLFMNIMVLHYYTVIIKLGLLLLYCFLNNSTSCIWIVVILTIIIKFCRRDYEMYNNNYYTIN